MIAATAAAAAFFLVAIVSSKRLSSRFGTAAPRASAEPRAATGGPQRSRRCAHDGGARSFGEVR